jgi:hypothetical protein
MLKSLFLCAPMPVKKKKIKIRSCSPTIFVKAATGYPLVVLA